MGALTLPFEMVERQPPKIELREDTISGTREFWCSLKARGQLFAMAMPTDQIVAGNLVRASRIHWPKFKLLRLESIVCRAPDEDFIGQKVIFGGNTDFDGIADTTAKHGYFATLSYSTKRHDLFLISADTTAEFLKLPPGFTTSTPPASGGGYGVPTRVPGNSQIHKVIPITNYTVKWIGVPKPNWVAIIGMQGRVNDKPFELWTGIADDKKRISGGQMLYVGHSFTERITPTNELLYDLTFKFSVRRIPFFIAGTPYYAGWNWVHRPDKTKVGGDAFENAEWQELKGAKALYIPGDFKEIFKQDPGYSLRTGLMTGFGLINAVPPPGGIAES